MIYAFEPPRFLLYIMIGISALTFASTLLKKGQVKHKIIAVAIVAVVVISVLIAFYRTTSLVVDETGIHGDTYGKPAFTWDEIQDAFFVTDISTSEFRPTVRTNGSAFGDEQYGNFRLKNGQSAVVALQQSQAMVVFVTAEKTYLFGPDNPEAFAVEAAKYVDVKNLDSRP